jgi:hypothetical protein
MSWNAGARHAEKPDSITPPRDHLNPSETPALGADRSQRVSGRTDLCYLGLASPDDKSLANDLEASFRCPETGL